MSVMESQEMRFSWAGGLPRGGRAGLHVRVASFSAWSRMGWGQMSKTQPWASDTSWRMGTEGSIQR